MVLTLEGQDRIRDLIYDDITHGQLGENGTAATVDDTGLTSPDASTYLTTINTKADQQINVQYTLDSTGGSSVTYKEFKTTSNTSSADYDRIVFTGIAFVTGGTENINIIKRYFIKKV